MDGFNHNNQVRIVQKKNDKKIYAIKYIGKIKCLEMKVRCVLCRVKRDPGAAPTRVEKIHYPLCVNLRYAFQDDEHLYMALDLMMGGDLRYHLENMQFTEQQIRGYIAEIAVATRFLHKKKIVHRDLKPDNVLLCEKGHAHLTDFNLAVKYEEGKPMKSTAGTMVYIAPEILKKEGYYNSIDFWSIGVILFEFMFRVAPFVGKDEKHLKAHILKGKYKIPEDKRSGFSKQCIDFLENILVLDVSKRLGVNAEKWDDLKNHAWFRMTIGGCGPVNFETLHEKNWTPPFVPSSTNINFDATHEIEEQLGGETLTASSKKRCKNLDPNMLPGGASGKFAEKLKELETKFTDFNYERMPKENADGVITMPLPTVSKRKGSVISLPGGRRLSLRLEVITPLPKTKEVDNESMHDLDNFDGVHSNKKEDTLPEEADSAEELAVNNDLVKIADTLEAKSATAGVDNSVKMTATHVQDDAGQMTMDKERTLAAEAPIVSALKKNAI